MECPNVKVVAARLLRAHLRVLSRYLDYCALMLIYKPTSFNRKNKVPLLSLSLRDLQFCETKGKVQN